MNARPLDGETLVARAHARLLASLPLRGEFAKNVFGLFAANAIAQALSFAAYPLLTRIYLPSQLGILSIVMFAMMLLTPLSTLRYEIALPICGDEREAGSVVALTAAIVVATSALLAFALLLLPDGVVALLGPAAPFRLFLPLALLAFGLYNLLVYEASRTAGYADIARTRVSQALVGPVAQVLLGLFGAGTVGLLTGFVIGLSSGTLRLGRRLVYAPALLKGVTLASIAAAARRHRQFPLFSSWAGVLSGSAMLGNIAFATLYGATVGGFLFLGDRILLQPLRVTGNAFLQVFVGDGGRMLESDPAAFRPLWLGVLRKQGVLAIAWLGSVWLLARFALPVIFGRSWAPAADFMDVMLIGYLPTAAAIPASHTLLLMGKQRLSAMLDALRFSALLASVVIALELKATALQAVLAFSVTQGIAQCLILAVIYREVLRLDGPPAAGVHP